MTIYVYLDESGSIHKNSKTKFFAVGGYFTFLTDKVKITSRYKKDDKEIKIRRNINWQTELKSYDMTENEKINHLQHIQDIPSFYGFAKVFNKELMQQKIVESNIFFNYSIKLLFKDCIIPLLNISSWENLNFIISIDNRNIKVGDLDNLENYLNTEFCLDNYKFKVTYYDSTTNYGIQLADLIVNTFYNYYKDKALVQNVYKMLKFRKFRISFFPGDKIRGRINPIITV